MMTERAIPAGSMPSGLLVLTASWMVLLALSLCLVLLHPLAAAPMAETARAAAWALLGADLAGWHVAALLGYASILLFPPLMVLGGFVLIERWLARYRAPREADPLIWLVQLAFALVVIGAIALLGLLDLPPSPRFKVGAGSGSFGDWTKLILLYGLALIVAEIIYYWIHRAQHHFAWLWKFHAVHHSQRDLDVVHGITHPVDHITRLVVVGVPLGFLVRFDQTSLCALVALMSLQTKVTHMRAPIHFGPLGKILADNRYHFIHHSSDPDDYNSNFSDRFPFIDMLFGTYRAPRDDLPETGLGDRAAPASLAHYMLGECRERRDDRIRET